MAKRGSISKQHLGTIFLIAAVFLGTLVASFWVQPEYVRVRSSDGAVQVEGRAASSTDVQIILQDRDLLPRPPVLGEVYEMRANGGALLSGFTVTFDFDPEAFLVLGETAPAIMVYDANLLAWRFLPTVIDRTEETLAAQVPVSFRPVLWSYGFRRNGLIPKNETVLLDELLSFPPEGAVGYVVASGFGSAEIDYILMDAQRDRGGCDGEYRLGHSETFTSREEQFDDNTYRLMVFWQVGEGCSEGERIQSENDSSTE